MITIKKLTSGDSEQLFQWRNNPQIYQFLFNPKPIEKEEHEKWISTIVDNKNNPFFVGSKDGTPCGIVQFKIESCVAEVGVYVSPEFQGEGIASKLIELGEQEVLKDNDIHSFIAKVLPGNDASISLFQKCDYKTEFIKLKKRSIHNE